MAGQTIETPVTKLLNIKYPVILAGMNAVSSANLAAAVSNAGGLGVVGGLGYSPGMLRKLLKELKGKLNDKTAFGVDLLLPKVGSGARKTNYDYTGGQLPQLLDVIIEEGARMFVCAVGVPPKWAVDRLHAAGILCANMVGHPSHVEKALAVGMDMIIAQGYEGGGHTGEVATMVLIPQCVDKCRGKVAPLHGGPVNVVAAGGIFDGRTTAAALSLGADAVWVGTRFVASEEASAPRVHKKRLVDAGPTDTVRTLIYSGRPLRTYTSAYVKEWEKRSDDIKQLTAKGQIPVVVDAKEGILDSTKQDKAAGRKWSHAKTHMSLMGQASGAVGDIKPAATIVRELVEGAVETLRQRHGAVAKL
eukprot:TRINITY_DN36_c0_g2_i1.p1 TRINITY_DN36_c0_g2~~TRINITY_DN36_c0_g2_i1.p1  ORF type:complete len:361 (+),score=96.46 TRINITY_DN36_c0_g2_i1:70-1152(+)